MLLAFDTALFGLLNGRARSAALDVVLPLFSDAWLLWVGAVLFLGESGTGKSTHTRLWQEHIPGARLLNDDSPIIRMYQGQATAFGSPWSGKTPCYRNISRPIAGIVRLSQAPANEITRLSILRAVGSLLPSCPPAFAYDSDLQDRICRTLSDILTQAPVWHLACLPDKAAAELSYATVLEGKQRA